MPFSTFEQFSAALCDTAGIASPELAPDESGMIAFHLVIQDVVVNLVHMRAVGTDNDEVFLLVTFGAIPQDQELEVLQLLAEANFSMLSIDAPVFGRNPATGEVVLRQRILLSQIEAPGAYESIVRLVALAKQWRLNPTLAALESDASAVDPHQFA
jgi:hypothetical protein